MTERQTSNYATSFIAERDALRLQLRARFDGHQGDQLCAEHGVCQLPRPTQQRHCAGYELDRQLGADAGRCRYKDMDNRCTVETEKR